LPLDQAPAGYANFDKRADGRTKSPSPPGRLEERSAAGRPEEADDRVPPSIGHDLGIEAAKGRRRGGGAGHAPAEYDAATASAGPVWTDRSSG